MRKQSEVKRKAYTALKELVAVKSFEKINVNDILAQAGISRATFYRHFMDKYDLLDQAVIDQVDLIYTDDCDLDLWRERFADIFELIKKKEMLLAIGHKYETEHLYTMHYQMIRRLCLKRMNRVKGGVVTDQEMRAIKFFSAGVAKILVDWTQHGYVVPAKVLARECSDFFPPVLKKAMSSQKEG